jgi:tetratricopeptide (TPR) repeat protein
MVSKNAILLAILWSGIALAQDPLAEATKLNGQALALSNEGRYQEAEDLFRSALAVQSCDDVTRASIATNLAWVYRQQDRYQDAEQLFRRALQWRQKHLPPSSVEITYSLSNLADVLSSEGRDWEARNLLETAVRILREFHPDAAGFPVITSNLAVVLSKFREYDEAEELLRTALNGAESEHGADSREVGAAANNLAQVLRAKKDFEGAAGMYKRAVDIFKALGPEATPDLATALANMGQLQEQQHQSGQARKTEQEALDLLRSDGNGPLRAAILQNLGNIVARSGNAAGSLGYFEESLNIHEKAFGPEHPATAGLLFDYAAATLRAGQRSLARKLRKRAEEMIARLHRESPDQFTVSLNSLRDSR